MEIKLLTEKSTLLTEQIDQLSHGKNGKLTQLIWQKDLEIQFLRMKVSSASSSGQGNEEIHQLQAYALEREQILAVLDEKTRENSHLTRENFRMIDIVVAKEADLVKLEDATTELSPDLKRVVSGYV